MRINAAGRFHIFVTKPLSNHIELYVGLPHMGSAGVPQAMRRQALGREAGTDAGCEPKVFLDDCPYAEAGEPSLPLIDEEMLAIAVTPIFLLVKLE